MSYGVYAICNTATDDFYIGKSKDIAARWKGHTSQLSRGIHPNLQMQNDWNQYGDETFTLEIIEEVEISDLHRTLAMREVYWIRNLNPTYNGKRTSETFRKIREANKAYWKWRKEQGLMNHKDYSPEAWREAKRNF